MKNAQKTADNKYIVIDAGFTNWEGVKYLFKENGLCLPGGSCYSVGFGGHIVGGGYGLLSRKYGLTIDYLSGIELVYSTDNKNVICDTFLQNKSHNDIQNEIVWAHKGCGGGNYGVITKYYFSNLPKAPSKVLLVKRAWKWCKLKGDNNDYTPFKTLMNQWSNFWIKHIGFRDGASSRRKK